MRFHSVLHSARFSSLVSQSARFSLVATTPNPDLGKDEDNNKQVANPILKRSWAMLLGLGPALRVVASMSRRIPTVDHVSGLHVSSSGCGFFRLQVCIFPHSSSQMANFAAKYSIMTQEMVDSFCDSFYIPAEVHPTAPGRDKTITQFPVGKVGVYSRIFDVCGYRIPFTKFFMAVLKYFRVHISQLSPFGAARVSHFEVLTRVLNLSPSVTVFRAFYTRSYSDGLFSFAKRSISAPSCFPKPPDSIKNWADHFFWVDSCVFPIFVPLYSGGGLEKDLTPHLTARQEQIVKLLESHKAPFRRYPECFLCLVGLSPYYPFDENSYPAFEHPDESGGCYFPLVVELLYYETLSFDVYFAEMSLFDFIKTADPRKVQTVEVQKGDNQVKLLESTQHCFMSLVIPAAGGSSSAAVAEVSAPTEEGQENVAPEDAYLELADLDEGTTAVRQGEEELRIDHPTLVSGTGGKTLAGLEQIRPVCSRLSAREQLAFPSVAPSSKESECLLDSSAQTNLRIRTTVESSSTLGIPVDTTTTATTFTRAAVTTRFATDVERYQRFTVGRWFFLSHLSGPRCSLAFFSALRTMYYDQLYTEFNVGAARQVCLGAKVRSRTEHELELKEKLRAKYTARGRLLEEKDLEILKLKSQLAEKEVEAAEKDHDIYLLNSCATCLASTLDDAKVACAKAGNKITSLASKRDRLVSEVSSLRADFQDFKERMETQQEEQALELYNRVAELEAHVMDIFGRLEGEFYPTYLTTLVRRKWLLTHEIQLALLKCLKSPEYQGTLGHALGRAIDFGLQEGLEAGYEHGTDGINLSAIEAYNPEVARASYINAVKALEDVDFPLVNLLKSKKDVGIDEVLDYFLLDGPFAGLSEAADLQPCIEQLSIPIHHVGDKTAVGETSLSFALMNVHARAEGAKKHVVALRQLMMEIVSAPLSSQTWVGEASTSVASLSIEDYDEEDTDEALGSVVAIPKLETCHF
ncbi:hypothetical protein Tco_0672134 [Tanacetum coccineum]